MKPQFPYGLTIVLAVFFFGPLLANAQSTSVQAPLSASPDYGTARSGLSLIPGERIPVARTQTMRQMEEILASAGPQLEPEMTAHDLLAQLRAYGLPIVLDETAIDDDLDGDTVIQFELPDQAIGLRLELALAKHNGCIQLFPDHAKIISLDNKDDPEYFVTLTYDVSSIMRWDDRFGLANTIRNSVDSDGWTQTGIGDQTMMFSNVGGRNLMIISAPWTGHVRVRQLMAQMTTLGGISQTERIASRQTSTRQRNRLTASTPVELPVRNVRPTPFQFNQSSTYTSGGGMGGGAFSVPDG